MPASNCRKQYCEAFMGGFCVEDQSQPCVPVAWFELQSSWTRRPPVFDIAAVLCFAA